jgi:hypothetical protein
MLAMGELNNLTQQQLIEILLEAYNVDAQPNNLDTRELIEVIKTRLRVLNHDHCPSILVGK